MLVPDPVHAIQAGGWGVPWNEFATDPCTKSYCDTYWRPACERLGLDPDVEPRLYAYQSFEPSCVFVNDSKSSGHSLRMSGSISGPIYPLGHISREEGYGVERICRKQRSGLMRMARFLICWARRYVSRYSRFRVYVVRPTKWVRLNRSRLFSSNRSEAGQVSGRIMEFLPRKACGSAVARDCTR